MGSKILTVIIVILLGISVSNCSDNTTSPTLVGKWKSIIVEGKQVTTEFSYWEFFENGTLEVVKWDDGRIEQSISTKWRLADRNDSTFLFLEVSGRQIEMPIFLYNDSLITIDPSRLDRPYKGRAVWQRVESSTPQSPKAESESIPTFSNVDEFAGAYVDFLQGSKANDVRSFFLSESDMAVLNSLGMSPSSNDRKTFERTVLVPLSSDSGRQQFTNTLRNNFNAWRLHFKVPEGPLSFVHIVETPRSMTKNGITLSGLSDAHAVLRTSSGQTYRLRLEEVRNFGKGWHLMQWDMI
jgi:hypothetical protein